MNIAIFGGTFSPPHEGHEKVAEYLTTQSLVDQVWLVPVFQHPWAKQMNKDHLVDYQHRRNMLNLITQAPQTQLKEYLEVSYTYTTLMHFQESEPHNVCSWVMGSEYIPKWPEFLKTHPQLSRFNIFVYPRSNHPLTKTHSNMTLLNQAPVISISSTQIRNDLNQHHSELNPKVYRYIKKHQLY